MKYSLFYSSSSSLLFYYNRRRERERERIETMEMEESIWVLNWGAEREKKIDKGKGISLPVFFSFSSVHLFRFQIEVFYMVQWILHRLILRSNHHHHIILSWFDDHYDEFFTFRYVVWCVVLITPIFGY